MSTIFISHSSKDNEAARDIERRLAHEHHPSVFLDLDPEKGILAGHSWERTLYRKLRACRAVIAVLTDNYLGSHWCFAEIALARMMGKNIFALQVPGLSDGAKLPSILTEQQYIDLRTDPTDGYRRLWAGLKEEDILGIGGAYDPRKDGPYLGLAAFEERHAAIFFGREDETRAGLEALERGSPGLIMVLGASGSGKSSLVRAGMVPRLKRQPDQWIVADPMRPGVDPFAELATVLERAYTQVAAGRGVRPPTHETICHRLREGAARLPRPSSEYTALGEARTQADVAAPDSPLTADQRLQQLMKHLEGLRRDPPAHADDAFLDYLDWSVEDLRHIVSRATVGVASAESEREHGTALVGIARHLRRLATRGQPRVVVIVDQFEELLGHRNEDLASRFLTLLRASVEVEQNVLMVVGTMRSDYLDTFQRHPSLRGVEYGSLSLGPMQVGAMREVIEKPAELADIELEAGLADELLKDTGQPDALPLLSFTLWKLYRDYAGDRKLEKREYHQLGGLHGAIAKEAAAVAANREPEDLRKAFLRMARITDDRSSYARQPASVDDPDITRVEPVLRRFAERRLVVFRKEGKSEFVEVAHEALFRSWEPLTKWLDDNRAELLLRDQIRRDALAWEGERRAADNLWRGTRLLQARDLMRRGGLSALDEAFVRAGMRKRRIERWTAAGMAVVVFIGMAGFAISSRLAKVRADNTTRVATAAEWLSNGDPTSAALTLMDIGKPQNVRGATATMSYALQEGIAALELRGHADGVYHAAYDLSGARIVTAGRDGTARIWDATTGTQLDSLCPDALCRAHAAELSSAAFSPDGRHVVTAGDSVWIWDLTHDARTRRALVGHREWINDAGYSRDGTWILTASDDGTSRIWDVQSSEEIKVFGPVLGSPGDDDEHADVLSAVFSPDGAQIATAGGDSVARIWNVRTGRLAVPPLRGHAAAITDIDFSPDGMRLATASRDSTVRIWDVATGDSLLTLAGHDGWVNSVAFSPDGKTIVTASHDYTARVWGSTTGVQVRTIRTHTEYVLSAAFSPDGTRIVTASDDMRAIVWPTHPGTPLVLRSHDITQRGQFNADGTRLVTAGPGNTARVWSTATGDSLASLTGHTGRVNAAVFSPDSRWIATASSDGTARIWNAASGEPVEPALHHGGTVTSVVFRPDGRRLLTASADGKGYEWDVTDWQLIDTLVGHRDRVNAARYSSDGRSIVTASDDSTARLWTADSVDTLKHQAPVFDAAFNPDGLSLLTAGEDNAVRIWRVGTGDSLGQLVRHRDWVGSVQFNQDGTLFLTASADSTVRLWDVATRITVWERKLPAPVQSAAFSPRGDRIVTVDYDDTIRIWDVGGERVWSMARAATKVCLHPALRRQIGITSTRGAEQLYEKCERQFGR